MNDRKKTIILLLLVFSVFGLAGWRVAGVPDQAPPQGSQVTTLDANGKPVESSPNTVVIAAPSGEKAAKPIVVPKPSVQASANPFKATVQPDAAETMRPTPVPAAQSHHASIQVRDSDLDQPVSPLKGELLPTSSSDGHVEVRADSAPTLRVAGVLTGDKPVAIIKMGDQQFVVGVGDMFGDGYKLKSVSTTQVVVVQGKRTLYLATMSL